jgi:hypothetical protein
VPDAGYSDFCKIDDVNKTFSVVKQMPNEGSGSPQYATLLTTDDYEDPLAPKGVEITAVNIAEGSTEGNIVVKMPTQYYSGNDISGKLRLVASIDGTTKSDIELSPGDTYTLSFSDLLPTYHRFRFYVWQGDYRSSRVEIRHFLGYDTPTVPQNILLTSDKVTWDVPTIGTNGLDLTANELSYEVYLNGSLLGTTTTNEMAVTLPTERIHSNIASVVAIYHDLRSETGYSNRVTSGEYLSVPVLIVPEDEDQYLVTIIDANDDGSTWHYDAARVGWTSDWNYSNAADDWLIMPPINFDDPSVLYEVGMDVLTNANRTECFEMWIGSTPNPSEMTKVFEGSVNSYEHNKQAVTFSDFVGAHGINYIAIHAVSPKNLYFMTVSNIFVRKSSSSTNAPVAVSDLVVTPGANGSLTCSASFTMPTKSIAETTFDADAEISVKIENITNATMPSVTVVGHPGETKTAEFTAASGKNEIRFTSYYGSNKGYNESYTFWAGPDVPSPVKNMKAKLTDNPLKSDFTWEAPDSIGKNGGWVNMSDIRYYYYYTDENSSWKLGGQVPEDGFYYTLSDGTAPMYLTLGVVTNTAVGTNTNIQTASVICGTPYTLPMYEDFADGTTYSPVVSEDPTDEYTARCGFANPKSLSADYATESNRSMVIMPSSGATGPERGQIYLPLFSTLNIPNPNITFYAVIDNGVTAPTDVYAVAYGIEPVKIGSFSKSTPGNGWTRLSFNLPEQFANRAWVEIYFDAQVDTENPYMIVDRYCIKQNYDSDLMVNSFVADSNYPLGEDIILEAEVSNYGNSATVVPQAQVTVTQNGETIATLTAANAGETIALDGKATIEFTLTPTIDMMGDLEFALNLNAGDNNPANDTATSSTTIVKGNATVVVDLEASRMDDNENRDNILLTWTPPSMFNGTESFEDELSFATGKRIADFINIDKDGCQTYGWESWDFPHEEEPHAFIVFDSTWEDIPSGSRSLLSAHSGTKFLLALSPLNYISANDWLISPKIEGGSTVSFYLNQLSNQYGNDLVGVYYSTTDNDTGSFQLLGYKAKSTVEWEKIEYTLPEDATYFAIRYYSTDTFGIMIDDISYTPLGGVQTLVGFDIERDGEVIKSASEELFNYTDTGAPNQTLTYTVVPVTKANDGTLTRRLRSNKAVVLPYNGVDMLPVNANIYVDGKEVVFENCGGCRYDIIRPDATSVSRGLVNTNNFRVKLSSGIYLVKVGEKNFKFVIK